MSHDFGLDCLFDVFPLKVKQQAQVMLICCLQNQAQKWQVLHKAVT